MSGVSNVTEDYMEEHDQDVWFRYMVIFSRSGMLTPEANTVRCFYDL